MTSFRDRLMALYAKDSCLKAFAVALEIGAVLDEARAALLPVEYQALRRELRGGDEGLLDLLLERGVIHAGMQRREALDALRSLMRGSRIAPRHRSGVVEPGPNDGPLQAS